MAVGLTDGANRSSSAPVDPGGRESAWESVLESGITATGIDPSATFEPSDDPAADSPQSLTRGGSDGTGDGSPVTPAPSAPGDDGATADRSTDPHSPNPAVPSDPAAPASPEASGDPDPLANAQPFTYTVDGQTRTMDGTYRIPGEGLVIPEDKVSHFELMASRADTLDRQNRELYDRSQEWDRLSAWRTKDAQGNDRTLTGRESLVEQRSILAKSLATLTVLEAALHDPQQAGQLTDLQQDADGNVFLVWNANALDNLRTRAELEATRADQRARSHMQTLAAPPPPPAPAVADYAKPTIQQIITQHQITGLTAADHALLAAEFPRYVLEQNGAKVVDPRFVAVIQDRAALRAEVAKTADAAKTAGKFNGAMTHGRATRPAPRPAAPAAPVAPAQKVGKQQQWTDVLDRALSEIQLP